jgi:hypothetical protein
LDIRTGLNIRCADVSNSGNTKRGYVRIRGYLNCADKRNGRDALHQNSGAARRIGVSDETRTCHADRRNDHTA